MKRRRFRAVISYGQSDQDVIGRVFRIFGNDIEIAAVIEYAGVGDFKFAIANWNCSAGRSNVRRSLAILPAASIAMD